MSDPVLQPAQDEYPPHYPDGFHVRDLVAIDRELVLPYSNAARDRIFEGLSRLISDFRNDLGIPFDIWINGSFCTVKPEPEDADIVVVIPHENYTGRIVNRIVTLQYMHDEIKTEYCCDTFFVDVSNVHEVCYWLGMFGFSRASEAKGIVVVHVG